MAIVMTRVDSIPEILASENSGLIPDKVRMELNGLQIESDGFKIGVFGIQTTRNQLQPDFIGIIRFVWTPIWSFFWSPNRSLLTVN